MKISVIIPAFNEAKLIRQTLSSVHRASEAFRQRKWQFECIVCNNNSTDDTAVIAQSAGAQVVFEPINQIGRARNTGARAASGTWLIFVDADSLPDYALFNDVAREIEGGRTLAGGSTVRLSEKNMPGSWVVHGWNLLSRSLLWAAGSFIFCESLLFRELGGFNEELFAAEELDLSKRLKRAVRSRGKRMVILHQHPLATSPRKIHLYSPWEHFRFLARAAWNPSKTLRNRQLCVPWYDGRR